MAMLSYSHSMILSMSQQTYNAAAQYVCRFMEKYVTYTGEQYP